MADSTKPGFETLDLVRAARLLSAVLLGTRSDVVLAPPGTLPPAWWRVASPAGGISLTLTGFDFNIGVPGTGFLIDRREVTNAEFKAFVDAGGYEKREYWTEPFVETASRSTGPQPWLIPRSDGPAGPGDVAGRRAARRAGAAPVGGVSWYEAAAYAAFRASGCPTIYHWTQAACPELGDAITRTSNFGGKGPLPRPPSFAGSDPTAPSTWPAM